MGVPGAAMAGQAVIASFPVTSYPSVLCPKASATLVFLALFRHYCRDQPMPRNHPSRGSLWAAGTTHVMDIKVSDTCQHAGRVTPNPWDKDAGPPPHTPSERFASRIPPCWQQCGLFSNAHFVRTSRENTTQTLSRPRRAPHDTAAVTPSPLSPRGFAVPV